MQLNNTTDLLQSKGIKTKKLFSLLSNLCDTNP